MLTTTNLPEEFFKWEFDFYNEFHFPNSFANYIIQNSRKLFININNLDLNEHSNTVIIGDEIFFSKNNSVQISKIVDSEVAPAISFHKFNDEIISIFTSSNKLIVVTLNKSPIKKKSSFIDFNVFNKNEFAWNPGTTLTLKLDFDLELSHIEFIIPYSGVYSDFLFIKNRKSNVVHYINQYDFLSGFSNTLDKLTLPDKAENYQIFNFFKGIKNRIAFVHKSSLKGYFFNLYEYNSPINKFNIPLDTKESVNDIFLSFHKKQIHTDRPNYLEDSISRLVVLTHENIHTFNLDFEGNIRSGLKLESYDFKDFWTNLSNVQIFNKWILITQNKNNYLFLSTNNWLVKNIGKLSDPDIS